MYIPHIGYPLGGFDFFVVVNNVAMNINIQKYLFESRLSILLSIYTEENCYIDGNSRI